MNPGALVFALDGNVFFNLYHIDDVEAYTIAYWYSNIWWSTTFHRLWYPHYGITGSHIYD